MRITSLLLIFFCSIWTLQAAPQPTAFREDVMKNRMLHQSQYGEQFCWGVNYSAGYFVKGYLAYGDIGWIEEGQTFLDWAISKMQVDPDGFPGWIGPPIGQENNKNLTHYTDTVVGDSIVCGHLLEWAEVVLNTPELKDKFGAKAQEYIKLATKVCWEKFNSRSQFYTCEAGWVSYPTHTKMIKISDNTWTDMPERKISNNLNKHYDCADVLVKLYRLTGKTEYKDRAIAVFGRAKSMFRYYKNDDRYVWNFWMPHGPHDIEGQAPKSWVSVHPERPGYQAGEVAMFLEAYDTGLVFDKLDIERMARTNIWMSQHQWCNAEGGTAGTLWSSLARVSPELAIIYEEQLSRGKGDRTSIDKDYYEKYLKNKGWSRLYAKTVDPKDIVHVPLKDGEFLSMTQVIPNKIQLANGDRTQFVTKTRKGGQLKIDILDEKSEKVLANLFTLNYKEGQYDAPLWDGSIPGLKNAMGKFIIRWDFEGEIRTEPIWIVQGVKTESTGTAALAKGNSIVEGFEDSIHWPEVADLVSTTMARSGKKSLEIKSSTTLTFGEEKKIDLPVKIRMWIYDTGEKHGKVNFDGQMWGVQTTIGNKFVLRQVWRKYTNGDSEYSWINNGENQFFSPHRTRVNRNKGWNQWVFDFSKQPAEITMNGQPVQELVSKYLPTGCVSLYFSTNQKSGPIYVDDISIEHP